MALFRGLSSRARLLEQLSRASAPALGSRTTLVGFATGRSSDDEEGKNTSNIRSARSATVNSDHCYLFGCFKDLRIICIEACGIAQAQSSARATDEQSDDAAYPHGRADLRSWVDSVLSSAYYSRCPLPTPAAGRADKALQAIAIS